MSKIMLRKSRITKKDALIFMNFYLNPKNNCDISSLPKIQEDFMKLSGINVSTSFITKNKNKYYIKDGYLYEFDGVNHVKHNKVDFDEKLS